MSTTPEETTGKELSAKRHIHFDVHYPAFFGCLTCRQKIVENKAAVMVTVDGQQRLLAADKKMNCPSCGALKENTPAMFDTPQEANAHVKLLASKFREGDPEFKIRVLDFGVISAGPAEVQ